MRPDEHKRKKNALYKKKHGIPPKGKEETSEKPPGQKQTKKEKPKADAREQGQRQLPTRSAANVQPNEDSTSSSGSDEEDISRSQKATFRRREIVSNWARYEEVIDDGSAPPTQRGEDFNKLLNLSGTTGSSLSQFRFRDEEDWGESMSHNGQVLAVDTEDLASVLDCLPLHKLLSIDPMLFSISQIKEQEESAKLNEEMYLQMRATKQKNTLIELKKQNIDIFSDSIPSDDSIIDQTTVTQNGFLDVSLQKDKISSSQKCIGDSLHSGNKNKTVAEKSEKSLLKSAEVNDQSLEKVKPDIKVDDKTESPKKRNEVDLDFLFFLDKPGIKVDDKTESPKKRDEVDLDFLLSLDKPGIKVDDKTKSAKKRDETDLDFLLSLDKPGIKVDEKTKSAKKRDEVDLDFLLSLDKPVYVATADSIKEMDNDVSTDDGSYGNDGTEGQQNSLPQETSEQTEIKSDQNKGSTSTMKDNGDITEDLEDWLDSMLDS
ncbi:hypothetical protein ACJMK2_038061 [Sinanodonta woodiana]|uniref:Cell death regulator Aven n=1 Tax=Sinanodonta woodiana TaxID=1069815 RepID=A0ABD3WNS9_SINWO